MFVFLCVFPLGIGMHFLGIVAPVLLGAVIILPHCTGIVPGLFFFEEVQFPSSLFFHSALII